MTQLIAINKELYPLVNTILSYYFNIIVFNNLNELNKNKLYKKINALIIRSTDIINNKIINDWENLKYIYTASAGMDHIRLQPNFNIKIRNAAGGNSNSVADYVLYQILNELNSTNKTPKSCKVGIIGYGHCGKAVETKLKRIGMNIVKNDPILAKQNNTFVSTPLEEIIKCDFITLHVPLSTNKTSHYPTLNLIDKKKLSLFSSNQVLINTARGGVVNEEGIINDFKGKYICDVFENEPYINEKVIQSAYSATPHIAGRTIDGKIRILNILLAQLFKDFNIVSDQKVIFPEPEKHYFSYDSQNSMTGNIVEFIKNVTKIAKLSLLFKQKHDFLNERKSHFRRELAFYVPKTNNNDFASTYPKFIA